MRLRSRRRACRRNGRRRRDGRQRDRGRALAAAQSAQRTARAGLQALHQQVRRSDWRRRLVRTGRAGTAARLSRQAAIAPARRGRAPGQPTAAAVAGAAEPRLGVRSRRRLARSGSAVARHRRSDALVVVQARKGHQFPRYGGDAAVRQFRLDARPSDHGGGDLRRHSGAHAGALRRQGRDFGLHHAGLERRPIARVLARLGQTGQSRAAQRPAPHHLQVGRRAHGGARARIWA